MILGVQSRSCTKYPLCQTQHPIILLRLWRNPCGPGMPCTSFKGGLWGNFCKERAPGHERSKVFGLRLNLLPFFENFDQTPGTYPRFQIQKTTSFMKGNPFIFVFWGTFYSMFQGVCWNFQKDTSSNVGKSLPEGGECWFHQVWQIPRCPWCYWRC